MEMGQNEALNLLKCFFNTLQVGVQVLSEGYDVHVFSFIYI